MLKDRILDIVSKIKKIVDKKIESAKKNIRDKKKDKK
jgi:hypothetical protein